MKRAIPALILILFFVTLIALRILQWQMSGNMITLDHPYAAFLESRAYGASLGATAEFNKMEWVAVDNDSMRVYIAMSSILKGMTDGEGDINLPENPCGIVYVADMDENYNIGELQPLIIGGSYDAENEKNACDVNNIASPDGLIVDRLGRLWIAEDSNDHENNMLWVYDPSDESLTRFAYIPAGAEVTGVYVTDNGTVFMNVQHSNVSFRNDNNRSFVGVIAGFNAYEDEIIEVALPQQDDDKQKVGVGAGEYQVLLRNGDPIPNEPSGYTVGQIIRPDGSTDFSCNGADGNMFLPLNDEGTEAYLYTNWECYAGGMSRILITMNEDRSWIVQSGQMLDVLGINGLWHPCGASVSPWDTALSNEEYEPDASTFWDVREMSDYLGIQANPYQYGYAVEIILNADDNELIRHYAMGRRSHENNVVTADLRTVYTGDDGENTMLFKFIADEANDLSCGTLYAASITQTGETLENHSFQIEWIELGHACNAEIEAAIAELAPK